MVKELVNKSEFARLVGVSPAAVTKACNSALKGALVGKRVNVSHPLAQEYAKNHALDHNKPPATGLDPVYEESVEFCQKVNKYSASGIQREFKIGYNRASKIVATMKANGLVPEKGSTAPAQKAAPAKAKEPHVRGHVAKREKMKQGPPEILPEDPEEMLHRIPDDIRAFADMSLRELVVRFGPDTRFYDWLRATKAIEDINEKRLKTAATRGELVSRDLMKTGVIDVFNAVHIKLLSDGAKTITRRVTAMHAAGKPLHECEKFVIDQMTSFIRPAKAKIARALKDA